MTDPVVLDHADHDTHRATRGDLSPWDMFRLALADLWRGPPAPAVPARMLVGMSVATYVDGQLDGDHLAAVTDLATAPSARLPGFGGAVLRLPNGYEYRDPDALTLAKKCGLDEGTLSLACALASEAPPRKYPAYTLAIAGAIANECKATGLTPYQRVTMAGVHLAGGGVPVAAGHFGRQSGRWCASLQAPTLYHVEAARMALDGMAAPFSAGARRWVDCRVMDRGKQGGKALRYDALGIVRRWGAGGYQWVGPIESKGEVVIDPYVLMLFERVPGQADTGPAQQAIADGRRRWSVRVGAPKEA